MRFLRDAWDFIGQRLWSVIALLVFLGVVVYTLFACYALSCTDGHGH